VPLAPERNIICKLLAGNTLRSSPGISSSLSGIINLQQTRNSITLDVHSTTHKAINYKNNNHYDNVFMVLSS